MSPREFQCRSSLPSRQECSNSFTVSSFSRWNFSNVRFEKSFSTTRLLKNFQFSFNSRAHISTGFVAKYYDKNSIIISKSNFFQFFFLLKNNFTYPFSLDSTLALRNFFFFSHPFQGKEKFFVTHIADPVPMSPLLATRNSCELLASFSDCLTDWGVDWWRGRGCLCVALLLGNGRVDTVAGGWVWVLWASCEVLTALGGSGSLPITDPDPDAANKIKYCSSWKRASLLLDKINFFFQCLFIEIGKKVH